MRYPPGTIVVPLAYFRRIDRRIGTQPVFEIIPDSPDSTSGFRENCEPHSACRDLRDGGRVASRAPRRQDFIPLRGDAVLMAVYRRDQRAPTLPTSPTSGPLWVYAPVNRWVNSFYSGRDHSPPPPPPPKERRDPPRRPTNRTEGSTPQYAATIGIESLKTCNTQFSQVWLFNTGTKRARISVEVTEKIGIGPQTTRLHSWVLDAGASRQIGCTAYFGLSGTTTWTYGVASVGPP